MGYTGKTGETGEPGATGPAGATSKAGLAVLSLQISLQSSDIDKK